MFWIKKRGTKMTIKRTAPISPANVRHVTPGTLQNPRHTHVPVPRSILRRILFGK